MPDKGRRPSVLVDTSFLISLFDPERPHHSIAKKYYKYFIRNSIDMHLSVIVIAEFNQVQPIADVMSSGNFIPLPFNFEDSLKTSDVAYQLGGVERKRDGSNPKYKDDLKLLAQASCNNIDFIITEDESTLARYCERLSKGGIISLSSIVLAKGFDVSSFNGGQSSLDVLD